MRALVIRSHLSAGGPTGRQEGAGISRWRSRAVAATWMPIAARIKRQHGGRRCQT